MIKCSCYLKMITSDGHHIPPVTYLSLWGIATAASSPRHLEIVTGDGLHIPPVTYLFLSGIATAARCPLRNCAPVRIPPALSHSAGPINTASRPLLLLHSPRLPSPHITQLLLRSHRRTPRCRVWTLPPAAAAASFKWWTRRPRHRRRRRLPPPPPLVAVAFVLHHLLRRSLLLLRLRLRPLLRWWTSSIPTPSAQATPGQPAS